MWNIGANQNQITIGIIAFMITHMTGATPGNDTNQLNFGMIMILPFEFRNRGVIVNRAE
jgi:hypothetical protein